MKKFFVVSDVHSFFTPLKKSLEQKGFDINNPNHIIIFNGDIFDRGDETKEVFSFIKSLGKDRRIMIKGNHEDLFLRLIELNFPDSIDYSNGTLKTFCHIANFDYSSIRENEYYNFIREFNKSYTDNMEIDDYPYIKKFNFIKNKVRNSEEYKFLLSGEWRNYFEIGNFIITHGFIPNKYGHAIKNWRENSSQEDWENARWSYGVECYPQGVFNEEKQKGKTIIVGHQGSYIFHSELGGKFYHCFDIFYTDNMIAIDGTTVLSNQCNILVLNQDDKGNVTLES